MICRPSRLDRNGIEDGITLTEGIRGSMAIGRVRIHDGVLSPAQILGNYNEEKTGFVNPGGGGGPTAETLTDRARASL